MFYELLFLPIATCVFFLLFYCLKFSYTSSCFFSHLKKQLDPLLSKGITSHQNNSFPLNPLLTHSTTPLFGLYTWTRSYSIVKFVNNRAIWSGQQQRKPTTTRNLIYMRGTKGDYKGCKRGLHIKGGPFFSKEVM